MDFSLTPEQRDLVAVFREYGERCFTRENVRRWCYDQGIPDDVAQEFASLYSSTIGIPGHMASGMVTAQALLLEELCRCAGATLPFANDLFGMHIIKGFEDQNDLSPIIDEYRQYGRANFALALSEPHAGSDAMSMSTSVHAENGEIILNGMKTFVNNGEYASYILVVAIDADAVRADGRRSLSFWLIPHDLEGISIYPIAKKGQPMLPFAHMRFDHVKLDPAYRLKDTISGYRRLFSLLEEGRVFTCAACVGMAQAAMEDAAGYAGSRQAFGSAIADFQQIQLMLVNMEVRLRTMRSILYQATADIDAESDERRLSVALMKYYIPRTATTVADDAMQIMGGIGYTDETRINQIWQDCRGYEFSVGTDQIMVYVAAPLITEKYRVDSDQSAGGWRSTGI